MKNVMIAFKFSNNPRLPIGYCRMIFDIKFDLTWKARLVLNGVEHEVLPKVMIF